MKLSVVTTLYRSAPSLTEFYERVRAAAETIDRDFDLVLVNDGSPDDSLEIARALRDRDPRICIVDLSRNFGHHRAIMAGLRHARGDLVFLIDCDLEEKPEWLDEFHERLRQGDCDVAYGVQIHRKGGLAEVWIGKVFYKLINFMAETPIPANLVTARLMTRRYVDSLLLHGERELWIADLWSRTGYTQVAVPVAKGSHGKTTYTFAKKLRVTGNAVLTTSTLPLRVIWTWVRPSSASVNSMVSC